MLEHNIQLIYDKLSDPSKYRELVEANADKLPPEAREHMSKVKFDDDGIAIESPMGAIKMSVDQAETVAPTRIVYSAVGAPVKLALVIELEQVDDTHTQEVASIEVDIPFFMAKMVSGQLKEGAQKFGEVLAHIPYDNI